jgi:large subunit ribosomal protein L7/L12
VSEATANSKLENIVEMLSELKVLDLANLKTMLEEKWGVKAAVAVAVAGPAASSEASAVEESTEFSITLKSVDPAKKIAAIKAVREITGLGLKEAKELVENPGMLKESASKAEAEEAIKKLAEAGAVGELKGL